MGEIEPRIQALRRSQPFHTAPSPPPLSILPLHLQRDIREFLGSYSRACQQADQLLFAAGDPEAVDQACRDAPLGRLLPNALYIHRSTLDRLSPLLRIYEGCARAWLGEIEDANIIKLHRFSDKVSYLAYPDFD
jgi:DNA phosphorothioation-associated putative methyltransferase